MNESLARVTVVCQNVASFALALTLTIEHVTAIFAATLRDQARLCESMHTDYRLLWRWHAVEIEHKAVAFDVYEQTGGGVDCAAWRRCNCHIFPSHFISASCAVAG